MNRKDILTNTAKISNIDIADCEKVINALEKVLEDEFSSQGLSAAFDKFCKLINIFKIKLI